MIVYFASSLDVSRLDSGAWRLLRELRATTFDEGAADSRSWCVPEGFETDFASVPRLPFVFLVMGDTAQRAAVLHDFMYSGGVDNAGRGVTRAEADAIFRAAMEKDGLGWMRRGMMWAGVRLFGGSHYAGGAS